MAKQPKKFTMKKGDAVIETSVASEAVQLRAAGFRDVEDRKTASKEVAKTSNSK